MVKTIIIKEVSVESNHFEFEVGNTAYTAMVLKENGERMDKVLVHWSNEFGLQNVWYSVENAERHINNGNWIVTKVLD